MRVRAHPQYAELKQWVRSRMADTQTLATTCFRVAGPRYTTADEIVSGIGGLNGGGRWNPAGVMATVYLSTDPTTAWAETMQYFRYYNLPHADAMPKVMVAVDIAVSAVLDLTLPAIHGSCPTPLPDLLAADWRASKDDRREAVTQAVGRAAFTLGLGGLAVPSKASPGGVNVVVFPDRLATPDRLLVRNQSELSKLGRPA